MPNIVKYGKPIAKLTKVVRPPAMRRLDNGAAMNSPMSSQPPAFLRTYGTVDRSANKYKRNPK